MVADENHTSGAGNVRPESEASRLLEEYFRIRRAYNALDRDNPDHAEERARLRTRYRELDRQYGEMLVQEGQANANAPDSYTGKAETLWKQAVAEAEGLIHDPECDGEWVEIETPPEGDEHLESIFEQALKEVGAKRNGVVVEHDQADRSANPQLREQLGPMVHDLADSSQSTRPGLSDILRELDEEAEREPRPTSGDTLEPAPESAQRDPISPTVARDVAPPSRIRPVSCPGCGETLPAGTETCPFCATRLIDGDLSLSQHPLPQIDVRPVAADSMETPSVASKLVAIGGWFTVLLGTSLLFGVGTGLMQDYVRPSLEPYGLQALVTEQSGLLLGIALVLIGGTSVGLGLLMAKFVRVVVPLHELARNGRIDAMEKAIMHGVEVDETDARGCTPLHYAVVAGRQDAVSLLLANGANVNARNDRGDTPLHMATANRDEAMCKLLVKRGADALAKNDSGSSLLHVAAWVGDARLVKRYIAGGCPIDARNENGLTPLHFAAQSGYTQAVRALIDADADVNASSDMGTTPIFPAARNGHVAVVEMLVEAGADTKAARDHEQATPLDVAQANKRNEVVRYLESLEAAS